MDYKRYKISRELAWEILLREKVTALPVSTSKLCRALGIHLAYGTPSAGSDGYSIALDAKMYILIRKELLIERARFTVAHELGHILLGHVGKYGLVNREPAPTDNPIEKEANVFASRLLAPACVLWGCGVSTAEEIAALCDISLQAAQIRAERMAVLYKRGHFLVSPLERKVYEQFRPFIDSHRLQA